MSFSTPVTEITNLQKKLKTVQEEGDIAQNQRIKGLLSPCGSCHSFLRLMTKGKKILKN